MWTTSGHEKVKHVLKKQLETGYFSHAYFFVGPEAVGKKMLAEEFARSVRGDSSHGFDSDIRVVDVTQDFGIDDMRDILSFTRMKPASGKYKVLILDNVHRLGTQSSNALLKTLEEPSSSTIIILVSQTRGVPLTILSRCQVFSFSRFTKHQLLEFAAAKNIDPNTGIVDFALGSPGLLVKLASDELLRDTYLNYKTSLNELRSSSIGQRLVRLSSLSEMESDNLVQMFNFWAWSTISTGLVAKPNAVTWVQTLMQAKELLSTNTNKKFILERVLLSM